MPTPSILTGPKLLLPNVRLTRLLDSDDFASGADDAIAVIDGDVKLTYGKLHAQSNMIARILTTCVQYEHPVSIHGRPSYIVAINMAPSAARIIAMLGVLKSGAAYLPLDCNFPVHRTKFMIDNSHACAVIAQDCNVFTQMSDVLEGGIQVIDYNDLLSMALSTGVSDQSLSEQEELDTVKDGDALAALFYTSGTTGDPKAVPITHKNIHYASIACEATRVQQKNIRQSSFFNFLSIAFPVEVFNVLLHRRTSVIFPDDAKKHVDLLHQIVRNRKVARFFSLSPTLLQNILTVNKVSGNDTFKDVLCSGTGAEIVSPVLVTNFFNGTKGKCRLCNIWGMTETTMYSITQVFSNLEELQELVHEGNAPIGKPVANLNAYIVDANAQAVEEGVEGEIAVSGSSVTQGYVFADKVKSFVENKIIDNPEPEHKTLFLTGDYGYMKRGRLYFRGRNIMRIKIRGYSVNAIEIDEAILSLHGVQKAATFAHQIKDDNVIIVSYVVTDPYMISKPTADDIVKHCKSRLPDYAIPKVFLISEMPTRKPQMKTDYPALQQMFKDHLGDQSKAFDKVWSQESVVHVLAKALGVPEGGIRMEHSFFDLGGNSANAVAVWGELVEMGYTGSLGQFLGAKTIEDIIKMACSDSISSKYYIQSMNELTQDEQQNVCTFIAESYFNNRNSLFRTLFPYSLDVYHAYVNSVWPSAEKEGLSFVLRSSVTSDIVAAAFASSANADTLTYEYNKNTDYFSMGDVLMEEVESPFLKALPNLPGKTLFASRFATHPDLGASDVLLLSEMMMEQCIAIAKQNNFHRIHSATLIPALQTRQIERGAKVWSKVHLRSFTYKDERPFIHAPEDAYHMSMVLDI